MGALWFAFQGPGRSADLEEKVGDGDHRRPVLAAQGVPLSRWALQWNLGYDAPLWSAVPGLNWLSGFRGYSTMWMVVDVVTAAALWWSWRRASGAMRVRIRLDRRGVGRTAALGFAQQRRAPDPVDRIFLSAHLDRPGLLLRVARRGLDPGLGRAAPSRLRLRPRRPARSRLLDRQHAGGRGGGHRQMADRAVASVGEPRTQHRSRRGRHRHRRARLRDPAAARHEVRDAGVLQRLAPSRPGAARLRRPGRAHDGWRSDEAGVRGRGGQVHRRQRLPRSTPRTPTMRCIASTRHCRKLRRASTPTTKSPSGSGKARLAST